MLSRMNLCLWIVIVPMSAHASWQYATWGMSPEQVIAASKGVAARADNPFVARNGERGLLTAPYATNNIPFVVHFWFTVGEPKLIRVSLGTQYAADCPNVSSLLFSIYGAPQVSAPVLAVAHRRDRQFHRVLALRRHALRPRLLPDTHSPAARPLGTPPTGSAFDIGVLKEQTRAAYDGFAA